MIMVRNSVTESVETVETVSAPTLADALGAIAASDAASLALLNASESDAQAFADACLVIFRAVNISKISKKDLAAASKSRGLSVSSASQVGYWEMAGRVLNVAGDLPDGVTARQVKNLFERQVRIDGRQVGVYVTAVQFRAIMAGKIADRADAYRKLRAQMNKNEENARASVRTVETVAPTVAPTADAPTVEPVEPVETVAPTASDLLASALDAVTAALAIGLDADARKIANAIVSKLVQA